MPRVGLFGLLSSHFHVFDFLCVFTYYNEMYAYHTKAFLQKTENVLFLQTNLKLVCRVGSQVYSQSLPLTRQMGIIIPNLCIKNLKNSLRPECLGIYRYLNSTGPVSTVLHRYIRQFNNCLTKQLDNYYHFQESEVYLLNELLSQRLQFHH